MSTTPKRVREPVQAYLAAGEAELLASLSERLGVPKAEVIRRGIRHLAQELELSSRPGAGLSALLGSLDGSPDVPEDLAARHDDYLYPSAPAASVGSGLAMVAERGTPRAPDDGS